MYLHVFGLFPILSVSVAGVSFRRESMISELCVECELCSDGRGAGHVCGWLQSICLLWLWMANIAQLGCMILCRSVCLCIRSSGSFLFVWLCGLFECDINIQLRNICWCVLISRFAKRRNQTQYFPALVFNTALPSRFRGQPLQRNSSV